MGIVVRILSLVVIAGFAILAYERIGMAPDPRCDSASVGSIIRTMNCR